MGGTRSLCDHVELSHPTDPDAESFQREKENATVLNPLYFGEGGVRGSLFLQLSPFSSCYTY